MYIFIFAMLLVVVYTLGFFDINFWTALFALVFGTLFFMTVYQ